MSKSTHPHGYIVRNETMGHITTLLMRDNGLWKNVPDGGILLFSPSTVTVFLRRHQASKAIERTRAYHLRRAKAYPDTHAADEHSIVRLVPANLKQKGEG